LFTKIEKVTERSKINRKLYLLKKHDSRKILKGLDQLVVESRVAGNLEYENLENGNLECNLISKISIKVISKKSEGYLEFNLEKDNLESMVRNFFQTHS
jgi:hypothetical protein